MKKAKSTASVKSTSKNSECKQRGGNRPKFNGNLQVVNPVCAGLDMHKGMIWVCTSNDLRTSGKPTVRTYETDTPSLRGLASFLKDEGVTTVALESTGVYWMPTFTVLRDAGLNPVLINPSDTRRISGRPKTDREDCIWICRLHRFGLLRASFVPDSRIAALKELLSARATFQKAKSITIQKMNDALVKMNFRLDVVLSDITGKSGEAVLAAIVEDGVLEPARLFDLLDTKVQRKWPRQRILNWLDGMFSEHSLAVLRLLHRQYRQDIANLEAVNAEILRFLESLPKKEDRANLPPPPKGYREEGLEFPVELRPILFEIFGKDLTVIPGVGANLLLTLVATVGTDLSAWPDARHFVSWLCLTPVASVSAGFSKPAHTQKGGNPLANAFRMAAMAAKRTKTFIGCSARMLASRVLPKKARVAVARKLAMMVFNSLRFGKELVIWTEEEYEERARKHREERFRRQLAGYVRTPESRKLLLDMIDECLGAAGDSSRLKRTVLA